MKTIRKLTALFAILCLLGTLWAPVAVAAAPSETAPQTATAVTAVDPLDAPLELLARLPDGNKLCAVYKQIVAAIQRGEDFFSFEGGYVLTEEEQTILASVVDATIPEGYGDYVGHSYCTVTADYYYSWFFNWGLTAEMEDEMDRRVAELTADLDGKSDFEKCRILYERLTIANRYDFGNHHQTAYGALVEGGSVCAGYGRAYQSLLQAVGIPCLYVSGDADNGFEIGGHAWNIVQLNGHWYYCDPTWDDTDNLYFGLDYSYFNIPYTQISTDHFLDANYELWVPKETAPAADFYTMSGLVVETLTLDQLIALMKKHNPLSLRILGDSETNVQAIVDTFYGNLDTIAAALGAPAAGGSYSTRGDHSIITLSLTLDHDHDYVWQILEPTCTDYGQTTYACKSCGDRGWIFPDPEPLGHSVDENWTCDEWSHFKDCSRCGQTIEYEEHTYDGNVCTICGYTTGCQHEYVCDTVEPTCTSDGMRIYTCRLCGHTEIQTILSPGHQLYTDPALEPTCMRVGYTEHTYCMSCGEVFVQREYLPTLDHDFSGVWQDDTHHGTMCILCLNPGSLEEHVYDNDHDADCNVCGLEREVVAVTPGDANGDGKVNNRDLGMLQKYLNDQDVLVDLTAADINGDGRVNNRDLGMLQRQLNE